MSNFKGTKGNWEYCKSELDPRKYNFGILGEHGSTLVADVYKKRIWDGKENIESVETAEANAKLISCAPEMLGMLDKVLNIYGREYKPKENVKDTVGSRLYKEIEQLIKKATEI